MFAPNTTIISKRFSSQTTLLPRAQTQLAQQRSQITTKNTIEVPVTEIMRIQQKCFGSDDNYKMRDKQQLLEKSKERVKKWPNTIDALRKKKDQSRFQRFKVDEEERRRIEEDEGTYQAKVKKVILEQANRQIYENNDRIRQFQGKLLQADVYQEREGMLELKQYQKEVDKARENIFFEDLMEQVRYGDEVEQIKKDQLQVKKKETYKVLRDQHDEMKIKYIKTIQEQKIEGELLKLKVQEQLEKEEEVVREKKQKQLQNHEDIRKGNEVIKQIQQVEKKKELIQQQLIVEHARKKENILQMRKVREEQKFKEKQDQRQKLIDVQIENLNKQQLERNLLINKQIKEAEIKAEETEKIKVQKREELVARINQSMRIADEIKQDEIAVGKRNNIEFQSYWKGRNSELEDIDKSEKDAIRKRNLNLQNFHSKQAEDKLRQREKQIIEDMEEQQNILKKKELEDKNFGLWAHIQIQECHSNGKPVGTLIKELTQYKAK